MDKFFEKNQYTKTDSEVEKYYNYFTVNSML